MVVFTCNDCGQSVKKNQVDSHCFQCRNCQSLSCMDCNEVFWGNEYKDHTKCVSEDQRYGGKDYQPKASSNKGEIKQEKWIEHIKSTMATKKISGPLSGLLGQIILYSNIPRKQSKFENFLKNSLKIRNPKLIGEAWEIFAQSTKKDSNSSANQTSQVNGTNPLNGTGGVNNVSSGSTPLKREADSQHGTSEKKARLESSDCKETKSNNTFDWCETSEKILQNFPNGLSEKKLRKQVIAEYKASKGGDCSLTDSEMKVVFRNKLLDNPTFCIQVETSKLSET